VLGDFFLFFNKISYYRSKKKTMGSIAIPNTFIFGAIVTLGFAIQFQDKYCFQALLIV
jgi:hypothetical protein